jgi:methionine-rich copper-binding protein CopC
MKLLGFFLVLAVLAAGCAGAGAHAIVVSSTPRPAARVQGDALSVEITFNSAIDSTRSHIKLFKPDGAALVLPALEATVDTLRAQARGLTPGHYRLHWQALSPDGHISQGDIPFDVSP